MRTNREVVPLLTCKRSDAEAVIIADLISGELTFLMTPFDLKRLESYANNMLDYHVILDLLPSVASLYFERRLGNEVRLSAVQSSILLALGLQRKSIEEVETELQLPVSQTLALFAKIVRKISKHLIDVQKAAISATIPDRSAGPRVGDESWRPVQEAVDQELNEAGNEVTSALREKQRAIIDSLDLRKYAIDDASADWSLAETQIATMGKGKSTVVSFKATATAGQKRKADDTGDGKEKEKKQTRRGKKVKR